ncbi:Transcriptional regulatory protein ASH1 [Cyberlindnera fabianii]|nr:Transcriptional regulatory protein ASH1 [Cyberlindnera fabianii]
MPASNLLHPLVHTDSSIQRKRYLEDLEVLDHNDSKRSRTAPPSPPLASAPVAGTFRGRSLSPTPPTSSLNKLPLSPPAGNTSVITPESPLTQLTELVPIEKATPIISVSTTSNTKLPPVSAIAQEAAKSETSRTPSQRSGLKLPSLEFLTKNDRYGGISNYSLGYPDTCINDDDWRFNLEAWIEKNFPEKFNNLKNMLRFDKPGFELLNDAIFLTELKEQLDNERRSHKPQFNSRISTKMVQKRENPYYQPRRVYSDHSDDDAHLSSPYATKTHSLQHQQPHYNSSHISSSPITSTSQLHTAVFPTSNYTYSSHQSPTSPTSTKSHTHHQSPNNKSIHPSSPTSRNWNGHHKLDQQPVVLSSNSFIHTQTHKGPNHTYTIHHHNAYKRVCISCGTDQSPCWRPSWSVTAGQLCNSCGLRYKKTGARCVEKSCCRIPAKGEWLAMESRGKVELTKENGEKCIAYKCLHCGGEVEVKDKTK